MANQTITVQYQNEVRPGKRLASIKTTEGEYFSVQPPTLQLLKVDHTYDVEFTSRVWQGQTYKTITNFQERQAPSDPVGKAPAVSGTGSVSALSQAAGINYGAERSARIERQHSQSAALDWFKLKAQIATLTGEPIEMPTTSELREMTNWLQRDISHSCEKVEEPSQPDVP